MPPKKRLSREEVADLEAWVRQGVPTPRTGGPDQPIAEGTLVPRRHWAFDPPNAPPFPRVQREDWVKSPIDRFLLSKLEEKGLRPAAPADRYTLLRRATYDLTGLPP